MSTFTGILSGRHSLDTVLQAIRGMGHDAFALPERGNEWACLGRAGNYDETFRVVTDERHFTYREQFAHPHTVVDIGHTLGHEELVRALVGRFGGWVREAGQQVPEPVPTDADVENPAYDLVIDVANALPDHEYLLARHLSRLGGDDPAALARVQEAIGRYLERIGPEASVDAPSPSWPR